ncbi:hypothetical protein [Rubritalea profundi]|uniref:Uncharacterized protein n=1 Tax=Rubritalea profundi TaxID=1658618 RepID=A0A2S7U5R9_9BACT|nr:hypothetical protein [Rubritalea profundi]PQJ29744.1 hypothetical protein BSZ32_15480 [Rubritalea profundi]
MTTKPINAEGSSIREWKLYVYRMNCNCLNKMMRYRDVGFEWKYAMWCILILFTSIRAGAGPAKGGGNREVKIFPIIASQGVAVGKDHFYAISNTSVQMCDKSSGRVLRKWKADTSQEEFSHFKHLNSGTVVGDKLYCAHSRYGVDANNCSVEIWDLAGGEMAHEKSIKMPRDHGSLTWVDKDSNGDWWMCYGVYGKIKNRQTQLLQYQYVDGEFTQKAHYFFPHSVVEHWGRMSCSGGSWEADGKLYITGHDHASVYVLQMVEGELRFLREEKGLAIKGQAIAWDRFSEHPTLWGIVRNKHVSRTLMAHQKE